MTQVTSDEAGVKLINKDVIFPGEKCIVEKVHVNVCVIEQLSRRTCNN